MRTRRDVGLMGDEHARSTRVVFLRDGIVVDDTGRPDEPASLLESHR